MRGFLIESARNLLKVRVLEKLFLHIVELFVKREELTGSFHHFFGHVLALTLVLLDYDHRTQVLLNLKRALSSPLGARAGFVWCVGQFAHFTLVHASAAC